MQPALDSREASLAQSLIVAQRDGTHTVDAALYAALDRPAAYRIQVAVLEALGQKIGALKTGIHSDGVGVVAPIYAPNVGQAPGFQLPATNVVGLEVEVGMVLARDIPDGADEPTVVAAIDHYFLGVEICGSRYADRKLAGPNGGLADSVSAQGYVVGPTRRTLTDHVDGLDVRVEFAGKQIYAAPAKHGFGTVLASLVAYARGQHPSFPLRAGTIITTGSLCGLVATSGPGHVVGRLGDEAVEFDIV